MLPPGIHRIHLERDDPVASGRTQVWRAWTDLDEPGKGTVVVEEGTLGGTLKTTQHGHEAMGKSPEEFLDDLIESRVNQDMWELRFFSDRPRYKSQSKGQRYFQFKPPTKSGAPELARYIINCVRQCEDLGGMTSIDWLTRPRTHDEDLVMGFRAPVQIDHEQFEIRVKGDSQAVVLSADVEIGSIAETLLLMIADAPGLPGTVAITDDAGIPLKKDSFLNGAMPQGTPVWLEEFGVERGALKRFPRLRPLANANEVFFI